MCCKSFKKSIYALAALVALPMLGTACNKSAAAKKGNAVEDASLAVYQPALKEPEPKEPWPVESWPEEQKIPPYEPVVPLAPVADENAKIANVIVQEAREIVKTTEKIDEDTKKILEIVKGFNSCHEGYNGCSILDDEDFAAIADRDYFPVRNACGRAHEYRSRFCYEFPENYRRHIWGDGWRDALDPWGWDFPKHLGRRGFYEDGFFGGFDGRHGRERVIAICRHGIDELVDEREAYRIFGWDIFDDFRRSFRRDFGDDEFFGDRFGGLHLGRCHDELVVIDDDDDHEGHHGRDGHDGRDGYDDRDDNHDDYGDDDHHDDYGDKDDCGCGHHEDCGCEADCDHDCDNDCGCDPDDNDNNNNVQCTTDANCADANPCTTDSCNTATHVCVHTAVADGTPISIPSNLCVASAECEAGAVVTTAVDCDDANDCTVDSCVPATGCVNTPVTDNSNTPCFLNDGLTCADHFCRGGVCIAEEPVNTCDNTSQTCITVCPVQLNPEAAACVDIFIDTENCGECGNVCGSIENAGFDTCCRGSCVDTTSNNKNCGACGTICSNDAPACCASSCSDLQTDPANCGACGNACAVNVICVGGVCQD
jgi:hypothetical protein